MSGRKLLGTWCVAAIVTGGVTSARGDVYYSLTGSFVDGSAKQSFLFALSSEAMTHDPITLRTWHYSGGTNAAGELIPGGGFDPWLRLYNSGNVELAYNDDINTGAGQLDARIERSMLPLPLPAGDYRLELGAFGGTLGGRQPAWAVDLVAGDNPGMVLTGASVVGGGTLSTLSLGSTGDGDPGLILENGQSLVFSGTVRVAHTGKGSVTLMPGTSLQCQHVYLAEEPGSFGALGVLGQGTSLTLATGLTVGSQGTALVSISDGASVSQTALTISRLADAPGSWSVVTVTGMDKDGTRSRWDAVGPIWVGVGGLASLSIAEGARVSSNGGCIACTGTAAGSFVSLGSSMGRTPAEWALSGSLYVGGDEVSAGGTGILLVQEGGLVTVPSDRTLKVWNTGTVQFVGGRITTGSFVVDSGGTFQHYNGILEVSSGIFSPGTPAHTIDGATADDLPTIKLLAGATATLPGIPWSPSLTIGNANCGALEIRGGSGVTIGTSVMIGCEETSRGGSTLTIDGPGSTLTLTTPNFALLWVGIYGKGSLVVSNEGRVIFPLGGAGTDGAWLGVGMLEGGNGEVIVDGVGSSIGPALNLFVGSGGWGVLRIRNGGSVSCVSQGALAARVIGNADTGGGLVEVTGVAADGTRSTLTIDAADPLLPAPVVGLSGLGTLVISDGALVSSAGGRIAQTATAAGSWASVGGSSGRTPAQWSLSENLYVGGSDTAPGGVGLLMVHDGGLVTVAPGKTLKVWNTGGVDLIGGRISTGSFVNTGGTFTHNNGILEINGGVFDPGTPGHTIDGATAADLPTIKLLGGATATFTQAFVVGNINQGALEIRGDSDLLCGWAAIGVDATSTGSVTVTGPGSSWSIAGESAHLLVGGWGKGSLMVADGGRVVVLETGSTPHLGWLDIGIARFTEPGGDGEVIVDGTGSSIRVGLVTLGATDAIGAPWGMGTLRIRNGGLVSATTYAAVWPDAAQEIGWVSHGIVEVTGVAPDGTRSTWTTDTPIHVGVYGTGAMAISNGALVSSAGADIARAAGSAGSSVSVGGWADQTLAEWSLSGAFHVGGSDVGAGDTGRLTVNDGGLVSVAPGNTLRIWIPGTVELFGGQITTGSFVNSGGTFLHHNGTLEVVGGVFDPGAFSHTIDGPTANERPTLNLLDGATASFAGTVIVGDVHSGALGVRSGATLRSGVGMVGRQATSTGSRAIVSGLSGSGEPAQWLLGGGLYVGGSATAAGGQGTLSIGAGGAVNAAGPVKVWPAGTLSYDNGALTTPSVELAGGRLRGQGTLLAPVVSNQGTIDTPDPANELILAGDLSIMPVTTLAKTGPGELRLCGSQTWGDASRFRVAEGIVEYELSAEPAVAPDAILHILAGASVNATGTIDPFTDAAIGTRHVDIVNESHGSGLAAGLNISGNKTIGTLSGNGSTKVLANATLTAAWVCQDVVTLEMGSRSILRRAVVVGGDANTTATVASGSMAGSVEGIPEPSTVALLSAGAMCLLAYARRRRRRRT